MQVRRRSADVDPQCHLRFSTRRRRGSNERPFRLAGDRFHPSWKRAPIALKDFLRGQKLPLEERRALPLVCSGSDVLAVCAPKAHVGKPHAEGGGEARALWIVVQEAPGE